MWDEIQYQREKYIRTIESLLESVKYADAPRPLDAFVKQIEQTSQAMHAFLKTYQ